MTGPMRRTMFSAVVFSMAMLAGCGVRDPGAGHSSSTLARSGDDVFAVNVDEGTVSRMSKRGEVETSARLGGEPTRIAATDDLVLVTLRAQGELVVLDPQDLSVKKRIPVGAEPYGVVTNAEGTLAWVAVSLEDKVLEINPVTGETLREFSIPHEPKWLALNPSESVLFVAAQRSGGEISAIDLDSGNIVTKDPPKTGGEHGDHTGFDLPTVPGTFTPRTTGDLVVSPDGGTLAVPTLYVDNVTPVTTVDDPSGGGGYGGDSGASLGRINPALVTYAIDGAGNLSDGRPVFLGVAPGGAFNSGGRETFRSYPNGVAAHPDSRYFAVSMEGSDAVVVVDTEPFPGQSEDQPRRKGRGFVDGRQPSLFGFWDRPVSLIATDGSGPRGVAFVGDELLVHTFLDRRIESVPWSDATAANRHEANDKNGESAPLKVRSRAVVRELTQSALPPEIQRGRRLFFSATDRDMSVRNSGISCATCHTDGRDDSLTWTFREGEGEVHLQTPSLAGPVNDTAPLTWRSPVATVADEALLTTTLRMGGFGPSAEDLLAIEAFVVNSRLPTLPPVDAALVAEGKVVFEREDVGCGTCHTGDRLTDGEHYRVVGAVEANTPGLRGIAATAPYLHDGSMKSLRAVLEWARGGEMGDTSMLSDREMDALEAYLSSL
jgi:DNA-binding beta-propeller fold protein YncE